jgi:hypothetical protein
MMEAAMASAFTPQPPFPGRSQALRHDAGPSCTIWYIQLHLGRHDYTVARMCAYVRKLIEDYDFPKPFPRLKKGGDIVEAVSEKSRWSRTAVDQWFHDYMPPDAQAAADRVAMNAAAQEMDGRAAQLQLVKGGRQ